MIIKSIENKLINLNNYNTEKKMKKLNLLLFAFLTIVFLGGCSTGGAFITHNATSVELSEANFNIVARDLEGYSTASYVFGVTYSMGNVSNTLALARVGGTAKLYDEAIKSIWEKYKAEHGDTEGKKLALINIRADNDMLNLLLYTQTELYLTADVVEFID